MTQWLVDVFAYEYYDEAMRLVQVVFIFIGGILITTFGFLLSKRYSESKEPRLELNFKLDSDNHCKYLSPTNSPGPEEFWLRLSVANRGKTLAQGVQLRINDIHEKKDENMISKLNSSSLWFKVSNEDRIDVSISPGGVQFYDVAFAMNIVEENKLSAHIANVPRTPSEWRSQKHQMIEDRTTTLEFNSAFIISAIVLSDNAPPIECLLDIKFGRPPTTNKFTLMREEALQSVLTMECKIL